MAKITVAVAACAVAILFSWVSPVWAAETNVVTPIFIARSRDQWRQKGDPKHLDFIVGQINLYRLPSTWMLQADALDDPTIINRLQTIAAPVEFGLFLEISQDLAEEAQVPYLWYEGQWTAANRLFTSGYTREQRLKLISKAMEKFRARFGNYPHAVGAWHLDGWSLEQLKQKYGVSIILGLADQYSTDGYQVWGQYVNQPYYISPLDPIEPATAANNSGLVKVLWAPRKQVLAFSRDAKASNYSVQVNDYFRAMKQLPTFFPILLDELTTDIDLPLAQAVVGIEVAELEEEYWPELERQIKHLATGKFRQLTLTEFDQLYRQTYPAESPAILMQSNSGDQKTWWFMSPYYRLGVREKEGKVVLIDLRYYQTLPVADNDQLMADANANLYREVPPLLDEVSLGLTQDLGDGPLEVVKDNGIWRLKFGEKALNLYPTKLTFSGFGPTDLPNLPPAYLNWSAGVLRLGLPETKLPKSKCFGRYGWYQPPLSCPKAWLNYFLSRLPDVRVSKINGRFYFGVRTGSEELTGIAFPQLQLGKISLPFATLEYFLSSRNIYPEFSWQGRQELLPEYYGFKQNQLVTKGGAYGQPEILKILSSDKQYEGGYYLIPR